MALSLKRKPGELIYIYCDGKLLVIRYEPAKAKEALLSFEDIEKNFIIARDPQGLQERVKGGHDGSQAK